MNEVMSEVMNPAPFDFWANVKAYKEVRAVLSDLEQDGHFHTVREKLKAELQSILANLQLHAADTRIHKCNNCTTLHVPLPVPMDWKSISEHPKHFEQILKEIPLSINFPVKMCVLCEHR